MKRISGFLLALLFLCPALAQAQAFPAQQAPPPAPLEYDRIISVNPIALVFLGYFSLEYEAALQGVTSYGGSFSYYDREDISYTSVDGKLRYYLGGRALDGLAAGLTTGLTFIGDDREGDENKGSGTALGVGFSVEQQWLMGQEERLALTAGLGGKRLFFFGDRGRANQAIPFVRLSIGWAF